MPFADSFRRYFPDKGFSTTLEDNYYAFSYLPISSLNYPYIVLSILLSTHDVKPKSDII
jgi:hypothetical protein